MDVRIALARFENMNNRNAIPIIKPFTCDNLLFLYINKNITAIPKKIPIEIYGSVRTKKLNVGAIKVIIAITIVKIIKILYLNLLNCLRFISLFLYILTKVRIAVLWN